VGGLSPRGDSRRNYPKHVTATIERYQYLRADYSQVTHPLFTGRVEKTLILVEATYTECLVDKKAYSKTHRFHTDFAPILHRFYTDFVQASSG
jgi:hypothetical protein